MNYKLILLLNVVLIFILSESSAQFTIDPAHTTNIYNNSLINGKIGIGKIPDHLGPAYNGAPGNSKSAILQIHGFGGNDNGYWIPATKITASNSTRSLSFGVGSAAYPSFLDLAYINTEARLKLISTELEVSGTSYFNSKVVINPPLPASPAIATPGNYRLYVQGGILTEKIKVALTTDAVNWSDFVFDKDYKLRSLAEVESYVKKHHHLPEIPSSEEVYKDGLDLAQMDAKLLMKIEELTLYMIELKKENEQLKSQMEVLNSKIK